MSATVPSCQFCGKSKKQRLKNGKRNGWACTSKACRRNRQSPDSTPTKPDAYRPVLKEAPKPLPPPEELVAEARKQAADRQQESRLRAEHKALVDANSRLEAELTVALELKNYKVYGISPRPQHTDGESVAVAMAQDWHVDEEVKPETVNGLNEYTPTIAKRRAEAYFQNVLRLVELQRYGTTIDLLHWAALGDFVTGWIHEENRENNAMPPVEGARFALELMASGVDFWLKESNLNIHINCMNGNHERLTMRTRSANRVGTSIGSMVFWALAARYAGNPRVRVDVPQAIISYVPLFDGAYVLREMHGDSVSYQGGVGGITVPLRKYISRLDQAVRADMTLLGHFHNLFWGPDFVAGGSLIGYSPYALSFGGSPEKAQQSLMLINRKHGRTGLWPVFVD